MVRSLRIVAGEQRTRIVLGLQLPKTERAQLTSKECWSHTLRFVELPNGGGSNHHCVLRLYMCFVVVVDNRNNSIVVNNNEQTIHVVWICDAPSSSSLTNKTRDCNASRSRQQQQQQEMIVSVVVSQRS